VTLELLDVEELAPDLHRIRLRAANKNAIPTLSGRALKRDLVRKDILRIEGEGFKVVSGGIIENLFMDRVRYVEHRPWMIFTHIPGFGRQDVQWVLKGSGDARITFDSVKATNRSITVEL
jgi:hypothetical protein